MYLFNVAAITLLGLVASPNIGVDARSVGRLAASAKPRAIGLIPRELEFDWDGVDKIKASKISGDIEIGMAEVIKSETEDAKKLGETIFIKTKKWNLEDELEALKALADTGITPKVLRLLTDDDDDKNVIGFVQEDVKGRRPAPADKDACFKAMEALHAKEWSHGDLHTDQFLIVGDKIYIIDFEKAEKGDKDKYEEDKKRLEKSFKDLIASTHGFKH